MATTGIAPIKQALVEKLRENLALKAMVGSKGINEGTDPRGTSYPYIVYAVTSVSRDWDWSSVMLIADIDVWSISDNQVEAHTLDQLVADALEDAVLDFSVAGPEQTSLLCRRIGDLSSVDVDGAGKRIFQMAGVYHLWTDQQRTA